MTEHSEDLGTGLRLARERSGVSLRQIADETKLSVSTLTALEKNRIDQLPGGIYRRALVRAYASHVGLDPEKTLKAFLAKYPDDIPTWADLVPQQPPLVRRRAVQAFMAVLGAVLPLLAGAFYFSLNTRTADVPPRGAVLASRDVAQASLLRASHTYSSDDALAMMLSVSSATDLQIVADGREVAARRFEPGEIIRLGLAADVVLVGDNAGAVHFSINGQAGRSLGDEGAPLTMRISRDDYQDFLITP